MNFNLRVTFLIFGSYFLATAGSAAESVCKDQAKGRSNFLTACNSYIRLEELSSGVVGRYKEDPCACLIREFRGIYKLSEQADCSMGRDEVSYMFRDDNAKASCIHKK